MSSYHPPIKSFFSINDNSQSNMSDSEAPRRKALAEKNTNIMNSNFQFCEKEHMYIEQPTANKFKGFNFVPNNNDWFESPQYTPQNNFTEIDDWPDFI